MTNELTDLQYCVLLRLIHLSSQTAVSDGVDNDWLVGLGAWLLEEFWTLNKEKTGKKILAQCSESPQDIDEGNVHKLY